MLFDIFKQPNTHSALAAWIGKTIWMFVAQLQDCLLVSQIHYFVEILQQSSSSDWKKVEIIPYVIKVGQGEGEWR